MPETKEHLRTLVSARLKTLGAAERFRRSALAVQALLQWPGFVSARTLVAYHSAGTELESTGLLAQCLASGKKLGLPRTDRAACSMQFHLVSDLQNDLEARHYKYPEPKAELPLLHTEEIELVVVPGLAFDLKGNRLGRGAGFYDRFLAESQLKAVLVGLAFECQIVPAVPVAIHDRPVQVLFTESRTIICGS